MLPQDYFIRPIDIDDSGMIELNGGALDHGNTTVKSFETNSGRVKDQ